MREGGGGAETEMRTHWSRVYNVFISLEVIKSPASCVSLFKDVVYVYVAKLLHSKMKIGKSDLINAE